jgi:opacity protein-like surface antigen
MYPGKALRTLLVLATSFFSGCTFSPSMDVKLDNPPGVAKVPKTIGVYYSPQFHDFEYFEAEISHRWMLPLGSASVDLFDQVFPLTFEKVVPLSALPTRADKGLNFDAVIAPNIELCDMYPETGFYDIYAAKITYRFDLYSPDGAQLASWNATGLARKWAGGPTSLGDTEAVVEAAADAMREAATKFMTGFSQEPDVRKGLHLPAAPAAAAGASRETTSGPVSRTITEATSGPVSPENADTAQPARTSTWYLSGLFGLFVKVAENPGRTESRGTVGMFAVNVGYAMNKYAAAEGDLSYFDREYTLLNRTTLLPGAVGNNIYINAFGFALTGKAIYPVGRWKPFVGAGAGYYKAKLYIQTVANPVGYENAYSYAGQRQMVVGYHFTGGVDYLITEHHSLGLEYRKIILDVDFGAYTNGNVDIGGDVVALDYRYLF